MTPSITPPSANDVRQIAGSRLAEAAGTGVQASSSGQELHPAGRQQPALSPPHLAPSSRAERTLTTKILQAVGLRSDKSGTLVIGCGRSGHKKLVGRILEKHQHELEGAKTLDIDPENEPHVVADITSGHLLDNPGYDSAIGRDQKFNRIEFEAVPVGIFDSAEKCGQIADNIAAVAGDACKVKIVTAKGENSWMNTMSQALEAIGFKVTEQGNKGGNAVLKAVRK